MILDDDITVTREPARQPPRALSWAAATSIGLRRSTNEDRWGDRNDQRFVVTDGVAGTRGGELASELAREAFLSVRAGNDWIRAIRGIDEWLTKRTLESGYANAASTLAGIDITGPHVHIIHVGDSRVYRLRRGEITGLTTDHNLANRRVRSGRPPDDHDGLGKPRALTSYLGMGETSLEVSVQTSDLEPGDRLLLCTDGVHEQMALTTLGDLLSRETVRESADRLVQAADDAGGRDNATALVVEVAVP